jgi:hypothetical protein
MFVPNSNYHKEEESLEPTKTHYPSNPKPSFKPKRDVKKENPKPRGEAFVCMFYGRAGHLDEFCFRRKRIERRCFDYTRNSYRDEFSNFLPRSYSRASPHTSSRFSHGPNPCSYDFGSRENNFKPKRFGYDPCPYRGDHFPHRPSFPARGSWTHPEPRHLDGPRFSCRDSCHTGPSGEVLKIVKTSSGRMVKCWISNIYLTNPSTEPSIFSHPM